MSETASTSTTACEFKEVNLIPAYAEVRVLFPSDALLKDVLWRIEYALRGATLENGTYILDLRRFL